MNCGALCNSHFKIIYDKMTAKKNNPQIGKTWKECSATDRAMVCCTIVLGIFTLLLLIYAASQFYESKQSSRKELRAYMAVWEPRLGDTVISDSKQYYCSYNEGNLGNTPAYQVYADKRLEIVDTNLLRDPKSFESYSPRIVVGAHIQTRYTLPLKYISTDIDTVGPHSAEKLFLYGRVDYQDVFEKKQWLTFCFIYNWATREFFPYHKYNEASLE
jgi:hypothetical protein